MTDDRADALEADRSARRGDWAEASRYCARAVARAEALLAAAPDDLDHIAGLAELRYLQAEILTRTGELRQAADAARTSLELYRVLRDLNPIHASDLVRDAKSRWRLIELMLRDEETRYAERVPAARARVENDPGLDADHDLARQLARQGLDHAAAGDRQLALPLLVEATGGYGRLRPLGEDDLTLYAEAGLTAAELLFDLGELAEAAELATEAAQAYSLLSTRRPERHDKRWYDARELASRSQAGAES